MSHYRIYVLNGEERIAEATETDFTTDAQAVAHAEEASAGQYAAEVWVGDRLVARLGGEFRIGEGAELTSAG